MTEINRFSGQVAIVTGAAGGIGSAVAEALAAEGAIVAAVDNDENRLGEVVGKLSAEQFQVSGYQADVTDRGQVAGVVDRIERELGAIDVLVTAAGVLRLGAALDAVASDWRASFEVNLDGVVHFAQAVARRMRVRRQGVIVTVASNAARVPRMQMAAYGASKAAAVSYIKTLGLEMARYGIRCNVVSPGSTNTKMLRSMWSSEADQTATISGSLDAYKPGIPLRRIAEARDIADVVLFLASDQARHMTMQDICVDGGAVLGA